MSNLDETIWELVDALAKQSQCSKRQVGCVIYNTKLDEIVGKGFNMHLNGVCDCHSTKTATHAEVIALNDILKPSKREDLVLFVSHAPCKACKSVIEKEVYEVRYRSQH